MSPETNNKDISIPAKPVLLNIEQVAKLLDCSSRHVRRLADLRRMPQAVKLGNLRRWIAKDIYAWLDSGCPNCVKGAKR